VRNLLFLSHRIPYPPDKGDKIRSFHILRHLSSRFNVHLGCFFDDAADERNIAPLREYCAEVFCLPLSSAQKAVRALWAAAAGMSITEACFEDRRLHTWVRNILATREFRDIFVFCSSMFPYVAEAAATRRVIIDMVDVDSQKWAAYAQSGFWPLRTLYGSEQRHVLALERRATQSCHRVLFVSQAEADAFVELTPELSAQIAYMENGVDLDRFDPLKTYCNPFGSGTRSIVFTGAMDYRPNVDAVTWFAHHVFPEVQREHRLAEFYVVGANPGPSVRRLSGLPGVTVTGRVSDVRPYLANACCVVAPLRIARGVQNKVLEAMAMAKPVVLTRAALEGLSATPGRHVVLADNASEFARAVSSVLSGRAAEIGRAARAYVESKHRWPQKLSVLDGLFSTDGIDAPGQNPGSESRLADAMS
jgi:sugar transferase (PEP-CTERM/EpsH1 system associated)